MSDSAHRNPLPVLDRSALERLRRLGGHGLVARMIELFDQHVPARVRAATDSASTADWKGVEHAAHSLKSTAANLGAEQLRASAEALEHAAAAQDARAVSRLVADLGHDARAALRALHDERKEEAP